VIAQTQLGLLVLLVAAFSPAYGYSTWLAPPNGTRWAGPQLARCAQVYKACSSNQSGCRYNRHGSGVSSNELSARGLGLD